MLLGRSADPSLRYASILLGRSADPSLRYISILLGRSADPSLRYTSILLGRFHKLLGISYKDHVTNEEVKARIGNAIGPYEDPLTSVKRRKLKW